MVFKVLVFAGISVAIYFAIAIGLILSQPVKPLEVSGGLAFDRLLEKGAAQPLEQVSFDAGDTGLSYGHVPAPSPDAPLILMVHGSGWYGGQFDRLAANLGDLAEVRTLTLRGHGADPERRGDVDYTGQMEDDIAVALADVEPGRRVVVLGHSSGGGLVVRLAGGANGGLIDHAILLAPFLQYDAATTRPNSGGWAHVMTRRIIGLSMLNNVGLHVLDHLKVIQFSMPKAVLDGPMGQYATTAYSWRLNQGFAPRRKYLEDIAALPSFDLIVGAEDESMVAQAYEPLMSAVNDKGRYHVVDGVGHLDVVDDAATLAVIRAALSD